jgi:myo-inositol-1(or 4)-monophosphatase
MHTLNTHLSTIEEIVCKHADALLTQYSGRIDAKVKQDGSLVTEIDTQMQQVITNDLNLLMPDIRMLGEEMPQSQQLQVIQSGVSFWCLDPVDGTNNFYHGVPLFAVSLALVEKGKIVLGIVYDPVRKECFSTVKGAPLQINGCAITKPIQPKTLKECLASVDFKRLDPKVSQQIVGSIPFKSQRNVGTCALEWAWLAAGRVQLLLHGGEKLWDYAAGCLLLESAGGLSCSQPGEAVFNGTLSPRRVIAASDELLHQHWLEYLSDIIQ